MITTYGAGLLLLLLLTAHALADFPLQTPFLAEGKNRHSALGKIYWPYALSAHALIHGGFVGALTGSAVLGFAETVIHWITDWLKCEDRIKVVLDPLHRDYDGLELGVGIAALQRDAGRRPLSLAAATRQILCAEDLASRRSHRNGASESHTNPRSGPSAAAWSRFHVDE